MNISLVVNYLGKSGPLAPDAARVQQASHPARVAGPLFTQKRHIPWHQESITRRCKLFQLHSDVPHSNTVCVHQVLFKESIGSTSMMF